MTVETHDDLGHESTKSQATNARKPSHERTNARNGTVDRREVLQVRRAR